MGRQPHEEEWVELLRGYDPAGFARVRATMVYVADDVCPDLHTANIMAAIHGFDVALPVPQVRALALRR